MQFGPAPLSDLTKTKKMATTTNTTTTQLIDLFDFDATPQPTFTAPQTQAGAIPSKARQDDDDDGDDEASEGIAEEEPTTFEGAIEKLGAILTDRYSNRDESEQAAVQQIVLEAKKAAIVSFGKCYQELLDQTMAQEEQIGMLQLQIQQQAAQAAAVKLPKLSEVKVPTLDWVIKNHKGKGEKLNGHHIYCMVYRKVFGHFPEEGVWKSLNAEEQKPWKTVATQYSSYRAAQKVTPAVFNPFAVPAAAPVAAAMPAMTPQMFQAMLMMAQGQVPAQVPVQVPVLAQPQEKDSKANSAYRLWLNDWMKLPENKGKLTAPAGTWKNVPTEVKAQYEAKFKALQAVRAQRA